MELYSVKYSLRLLSGKMFVSSEKVKSLKPEFNMEFNYLKKRPNLNDRSPQTKKGALIWKFSMSAEALIQKVCKNDELRVFFSQIFFVFYNKEIYKHIL